MFQFIIKSFLTLILLQTTLLSREINIDKIIQQAQKSDKQIILYFHRIGCSYCNSMQEFTLDDDDVKEYIQNNFTLIRINISLKDTITFKGKISGGICLAKRIGYNFYPSTLFLDKNANIRYAAVGYKNESEFLMILQYIKSGQYKNKSLQKYMKDIHYNNNNTLNEIQDTRKHVR